MESIWQKPREERIKILNRVVREFCKRPSVKVRYKKISEIGLVGGTNGKTIYIDPDKSEKCPVPLYWEISAVLHEISHINLGHTDEDELRDGMEIEAEMDLVKKYLEKFKKDKNFREKFGID